MKILKVSLEYSSLNYAPAGSMFFTPLVLPVRVLDIEGGLIAEGVTQDMRATAFDISSDIKTVFVRLTWPSGKSQTQRVNFEGKDSAEISFNDQAISHNEWSAWAVPRLNPQNLFALSGAPTELRIGRFDSVWLRLWEFKNGRWSVVSVNPTTQYSNVASKQLDLPLTDSPWLLQVGGPTVPWQFVSLPGGAACRVLLTPNDSKDPRKEPLKIVVTSFRSEAEILLEFLSRDALRAAASLATGENLAMRLMYNKFDDPLAAVAAAYYLLRTQGWQSVPPAWFDNLETNFRWISDAAIISCIVTIRKGLQDESDAKRAREMVMECLNRGLPVYAEGLSLLREAISVLSSPSLSEPLAKMFSMIERLSSANAWAGSAFSFYGRTPDEPNPRRLVGSPWNSRPLQPAMSRKIGRGRRSSSDPADLARLKKRLPSSDATDDLEQMVAHIKSERRKRSIKTDAAANSPEKTRLMYLGEIGMNLSAGQSEDAGATC